MPTIDVIVTRHGKKISVDRSRAPAGGIVDRTEVGLSPDGMDQMYAVGEKELKEKEYDRIVVVSSDFLRATQSAEQMLRGAGLDPEQLRQSQRGFRFSTDTSISLGGYNWAATLGPKIGDTQHELDAYLQSRLLHYALRREGADPQANLPVLAECASSLFSAVHSGIVDLEAHVKKGQSGALIVVTHQPLLEAFARYLTGEWKFVLTDRKVEGNEVREISLPVIHGHMEGRYIHGHISPISSRYTLNVQGQEIHGYIAALRNNAANLCALARGCLQPATQP